MALASMVALGTLRANAAVLAQFDFDSGTYTAGALGGQEGWVVTDNNSATFLQVGALGLAHTYNPGSGDIIIPGAPYNFQITGDADGAFDTGHPALAWNTFSSTAADKVFMRFNFRHNGPVDSGEFFFVSISANGAANPNNGGRAYLRSGQFQAGSRNTATTIGTGPPVSADTDYTLVLAVSKSVSGAAQNYDAVSLYIDPDLSSGSSEPFTAQSAVTGASIGTPSLAYIYFRSGDSGGDIDSSDTLMFDSFVIGTTWADVALADGTTTISTTTSSTTTSSTTTTAPLVVAVDVADNYGDAWAGNGGTGFEPWVFVTDVPAGAAGVFLANTTAQTDLNHIWSTPDFKGWGTYANGAGYQAVAAFRAFADSKLSTSGDVFRVSMENGAVQAGTTCGVVLRNGNDNLIVDDFDNNQRLQFFFRGDDANYKVWDDAGERDSGVAWTADGLDLVVSLTGQDTYRLDLYQANGGALANSLTGTLAGSGVIDSLALFNRDAEAANVYFNKLSLATATAVTTTTDTSTTTTTSTTDSTTTDSTTTTTTTSSTTAGITYFVRTAEEGGNDGWDGLSPTYLGGFSGPKLHVDNAVSTANPVDGYHTIDIGVGVFKTIHASPTRPMRIVGKGIGQTLLDGPGNSESLYHFSIAGVVGASASRPLLFRDFSFVNTNAVNGNIILAGGGTPDHVRLEQVSADDFKGLLYGIRMNNNNPAGIGNADWVFKNFSATNLASGGGEWLFLRSNANTPSARTQRWVFDQATITDNGTIYGSLTDGRWVVEGFRLTNSTWSRNANNGSYGLNGSTTTDFLGRNRIDDSTIEDNNLYGVWAPRMGAGADLIIENAIIRDTPAGHVQCTQVYLTIEAATAIGQIRAVNTVFDSLGGCVGSHGLHIEDNGAVQTSPIELKNVAFNNCGTGLFIGGTSANLWYIDPAQSGATINGGTLVSGGRMTVYGDANLDGEVNVADIAAVGGFPFTYRENATWADGDFDFDGDFDSQDWMWLPVPNALWLIIR